MAAHLRSAAAEFRNVMASIEAERMVFMHAAGVTDDHVTIPSEARRMRYYDPSLAESVPPEPFDS
jgi:hypothetical protein